jgi:hypothetical protein
MEPQLYVISVGDKHYVSGTIYTSDGIKQYSGVLSNFEQLFTLFPTFATTVNCYNDYVCMRDHIDFFYYLTYRGEDELVKMLTFMNGASISYLQFIPEEVIKKLDIHFSSNSFHIGGANVLKNVECNVIGSIPSFLVVTYGYVSINGVKIGSRDISGDYDVCGQLINLEHNVLSNLSYLLGCYFLNHYKGTPTWSEVLKTWCGIKMSLMM